MAKKPVTKNNQIKKTQKNPNKTPTKAIPKTKTKTTAKTSNTKKEPAVKKTSPKKPKDKILDNISILKSSPYFRGNNKSQLNQIV